MNFEYRLQILEHHLDTFGHVNNAVYLEIFEEARWDFITQNGFGLDRILREQQGPVVLEVNVKFKRELKNREWITIISIPESVESKIMKITQQILKDDGKVACEATITVGFMDMKERKLIAPPADWARALGKK